MRPCHTTDLSAGGNDDYRVHVYLVFTYVQLNNVDCGLEFSKITLLLLQEMFCDFMATDLFLPANLRVFCRFILFCLGIAYLP